MRNTCHALVLAVPVASCVTTETLHPTLNLDNHLFKLYRVHYLRKIWDGFNFGQKWSPKLKPSEIFLSLI